MGVAEGTLAEIRGREERKVWALVPVSFGWSDGGLAVCLYLWPQLGKMGFSRPVHCPGSGFQSAVPPVPAGLGRGDLRHWVIFLTF